MPRKELAKLYGDSGDPEDLKTENLTRAYNREPLYFTVSNPDEPNPDKRRVAKYNGTGPKWRLLLSGRAVKGKPKDDGSPAIKKEALFIEGTDEITLPPALWKQCNDLMGDSKNTLDQGDLVWLEPKDEFLRKIVAGRRPTLTTEDVKTIQRTRWYKKSANLLERIDEAWMPDFLRNDGLVDCVTNLFGQVNNTGNKKVPCFAGRVWAENLVFEDCKKDVQTVDLAPLCNPHPGCYQFYQSKDQFRFRGYKVYRVAREGETPWRYDLQGQGVFDNQGKLIDFKNQEIARRVQLLPAQKTGKLRIAFHALTPEELQLLYTTCTATWRLGGGKPLGLGLCQTKAQVFLWNDQTGKLEADTQDWTVRGALAKLVGSRLDKWEKSQEALPTMRYPRAASQNNWSKQRGGHAWFPTFSTTKKNQGKQFERKLQEVASRNGNLPGQFLPELDDADQALYGYDVLLVKNGRRFDAFRQDPPTEVADSSGQRRPENTSNNRQSRNQKMRNRGKN